MGKASMEVVKKIMSALFVSGIKKYSITTSYNVVRKIYHCKSIQY